MRMIKRKRSRPGRRIIMDMKRKMIKTGRKLGQRGGQQIISWLIIFERKICVIAGIRITDLQFSVLAH